MKGEWHPVHVTYLPPRKRIRRGSIMRGIDWFNVAIVVSAGLFAAGLILGAWHPFL